MTGEFDEAINQALHDYELMRRKAAAWDRLLDAAMTGHLQLLGAAGPQETVDFVNSTLNGLHSPRRSSRSTR